MNGRRKSKTKRTGCQSREETGSVLQRATYVPRDLIDAVTLLVEAQRYDLLQGDFSVGLVKGALQLIAGPGPVPERKWQWMTQSILKQSKRVTSKGSV